MIKIMAEVYKLENKDSSLKEFRTFELNSQDMYNEEPSTYIEVLGIFREVFRLIDFSQIIRKHIN